MKTAGDRRVSDRLPSDGLARSFVIEGVYEQKPIEAFYAPEDIATISSGRYGSQSCFL